MVVYPIPHPIPHPVDSMDLYSSIPIKAQPAGQAFISFGPNLSPTELLMDYGFVDDANRNYKIEIETKAVGES